MSQREIELKSMIEDILWMAVRYAHGRHTYAPSMVRKVVSNMKRLYPDWKIYQETTLEKPKEEDIKGMVFRDDYLNDLFQ